MDNVTTDNKDILISGASVAGPALAWWLARRGFRPVIVERAAHLREGGYAVDFRGPVHLRVLEQMGLLEQARARQTALRSLTYVDGGGQPVAAMPAVFFAGDLEILRGDLAALLYQATRDDTEYIFGDTITGLDQDADGVHVTFAHAAPRTFGLVIGADGVHSGIRRLAFGPDEDFIRDLGLYVSVFTVPNFAGLDRSGLLHAVPGKTAGLIAAGDPATALAQLYFTAPGLRYDPADTAAQRQIITERFAGLGWEVPRLLAAMPAASDFYFDTASQVHLDRWSDGRVALIGDAAHAAGPGGNGTGNAVVAAAVLATELASPGDHQAALARYEQRLRPYVARAQKQAADSQAFLAPATWKKINQRNRFYKALPYLPISGFIRRSATKTAAAITLPDSGPARS
jgi:2-polyprenyl-6-methoxyphenol hydroxylase-like FAD-dependent oxidoreductase